MSQGGGRFIVGKIIGAYGVNGWVKVLSHTRPLQEIFQYSPWLLATDSELMNCREVQVTAKAVRGKKALTKKLFAKIAGVNSREDAENLNMQWIAITNSQLAILQTGEYYWNQLIGLTVTNQQHIIFGVVDHLLETGANDVLVVRDADNNYRERLIPWSPHFIVEVDMAGRQIRVNWPADY